MFLTGFNKIAVTLVTMTPEEYYDVVREKDPYVGASVGSLLGAGVAHKKLNPKHALLGAGVGAVTGGTAAHFGGKLLRKYQANKVRRMAEDLNLRSTPTKSHK